MINIGMYRLYVLENEEIMKQVQDLLQKEIMKQVQELLHKGVIQPSTYPCR
jgi:hypothetical protein